MAKLLVQNSGALEELATVASSAGPSSAGAIPHLDANGILSPSFGTASTRKLLNGFVSNVTALAPVFNLSLDVEANSTYSFKFLVIFSSDASTVGLKLGLQGPAFNLLAYRVSIATNTTTEVVRFLRNYNIPVSSTRVELANQNSLAVIEGIISPSVAGVLTVQAASEYAGTNIRIKPGSGGVLSLLV